MAFGGGDCKLCKCQGSFAGNQTLAAMVFRSEAQDKAKSSDYCRNEHAQCMLRRNLRRNNSSYS